MKKHLILFFLAGILSLNSCSSNDETDTKDPIIGTWTLVEVNPSTIMFNIEQCTEQSTITFLSNNMASATLYMASNDCDAQPIGGTWTNLGDSTYELTVPLAGLKEKTKVDFEGSGTFSFTYMETQLTFERQ